MKFGVFTVSMPEYDPAQSVALLKELGYDGVEWRVTEMPDEEPKDVPYAMRYWAYNKSTLDVRDIAAQALEAKRLCDEAGLEIFALTTYLPLEEHEKIAEVAKAAKSIGCHRMRAGLVNYNPATSDKTYPELIAATRENLKALEPILKENDVKLMLETHHDTLVSSPSASYRMLEGFDPHYYGIILDPGNMVYEGFEDYQKTFELLGDYLAHVHVKNSMLESDGVDEFGAAKWKRSWMPLKKGMANLKHLFEVMAAMGYDGTVSVEDFSNELSTRDKLADNIAYLHELQQAVKC